MSPSFPPIAEVPEEQITAMQTDFTVQDNGVRVDEMTDFLLSMPDDMFLPPNFDLFAGGSSLQTQQEVPALSSSGSESDNIRSDPTPSPEQQYQQQEQNLQQQDQTHAGPVISPQNYPFIGMMISHESRPAPQERSTNANRKMRSRQPIFVTENPQFKKGRKGRKSQQVPAPSGSSSSSPPSNEDSADEDDLIDATSSQLKQMTSKERRQLRNKISARNFRVRRKEYIEQLEGQVQQKDEEIQSLREANKRLTEMNQQLEQELQQWRQRSSPMTAAESNTSHYSPNGLIQDSNMLTDSAANVPDIFPLLDMYDYGNFNHDSHLAHAIMPDWDFFRVLDEKNMDQDSQNKDAVLKPYDFMRNYPLMVPALMSLVVQHTFDLKLQELMADTLTSSSKGLTDLLTPQAWMSLVMDSSDTKTLCGDDDSEKFKLRGKVVTASGSSDGEDGKKEPGSHHRDGRDAQLEEDKEVKRFLRKHYVKYIACRVMGHSHEECINCARESLRSRRAQAPATKAAPAPSKTHTQCKKTKSYTKTLSTMVNFYTIGKRMLRQPQDAAFLVPMLKMDRQVHKFIRGPERREKFKATLSAR
ncbi:hypothetical protein BCR43DRAFT_563406 [Syncephalastrum racemosum]|uniref:BZIP domain-containing protein n=1 Tax=Syncephalastrum racemosum TaxID=13706 RepID=A0A1X2HGN7_SYNRA|nr:hypothetical protein BCR43DRAFT_563406 [Syncephalastrum racemosum]